MRNENRKSFTYSVHGADDCDFIFIQPSGNKNSNSICISTTFAVYARCAPIGGGLCVFLLLKLASERERSERGKPEMADGERSAFVDEFFFFFFEWKRRASQRKPISKIIIIFGK